MLERMRRLLRIAWRAPLLAAWTLACTLQVACAKAVSRLWPRAAWRWRGRWLRRWGRGLCRVLGVRLEIEGEPPGEPFFLVSNHLSYLDIPVFGAVANVVFVAKSEVADWPLLGTVCRAADTIFVVRGSRRDSLRANEALGRHLRAGHSVLLFPEGTTSDGSAIRPFRAPLLQAAAAAGLPVHAAVLEYATGPGDPPAAEAVCWWGGTQLLAHVRLLLGVSRITARLRFSPHAVEESERKLLAARLHEEVVRLAGERAGTDVILGLGSNVDAERNLPLAVERLARRLDVRAASAVYESDPVGAPGTPRFLNAALLVRTVATADALKHDVLRPLEAELGRRRTDDPNAPREIDLDVVLFGDRVIRDPERGLDVPDPALATAAHVVVPAAEVWPQAVHPELGVTLERLAARIGRPPGMRRRGDLDLASRVGNNGRQAAY